MVRQLVSGPAGDPADDLGAARASGAAPKVGTAPVLAVSGRAGRLPEQHRQAS